MHPPAWAVPRRQKHHFVKMLAISLTVILSAAWTLASILPRRSVFEEPLRFTDNGTFQISIFEDLHFGEGKRQGTYTRRDNTNHSQSPG
jgi:hypothetical protein